MNATLPSAMTPEDMIETFELLGDWEERYRFLIELGRELAPLPEGAHTDANKVRGCMSQVWLTYVVEPGPQPRLVFYGDSDAHIVKGLIAVLLRLLSGRTPQAILDLDVEGVFDKLGLQSQISMNRRNGFYAMHERIRSIARKVATAA